MTLLAPWLMLGGLLAAVPIVIHLLNKPKFRLERWGAMRFLAIALQKRSRTVKVQQILLMVLRALFFVLLALALARPALRAAGFSTVGQPTTHVFVFDDSYSMRQGENRENAFFKAKQAALTVVDRMAPQDSGAIIRAGRKPVAVTPSPLFNRLELRKKIEALEPGWGSADVPAAIEQALWLLQLSQLPRHRIYLLSDGQAGGWMADDAVRWAALDGRVAGQRVRPAFHAVLQAPALPVRNAAVTALYSRFGLLDIHRPAEFVADVENYGGERMPVDLLFEVDGTVVEQRAVSLQKGVNNYTFQHTFDRAGSHAVSVRFRDDDLQLDNRACLAVEVLASVPVLLVEGVGAADPFESDGGLLQWALEAGGRGDGHLFTVTRQRELDLPQIDYSALIDYKAVLLANVSALPAEFAAAVARYVASGGGLLIAAGPRLNPAAYNRLFQGEQGFLPAELGARWEDPADPRSPEFPAGRAMDALRLFDVSRTRRLADVRVNALQVATPASDAMTAAIAGDHPLLVLKRFGNGAAALWTTTLNLQWNSFPAVPDFVPLMQNLVFYLSSQVVPPINLVQGETLVYSYSRALALLGSNTFSTALSTGLVCTVTGPDGRTNQVALVDTGGDVSAYWAETGQPGFYEVRAGALPPRTYAVTLPSAEGSLEPLDGAVRASLARRADWTFSSNADELRTVLARDTGMAELSTFLLLAAILLLVVEMVLAWRFSG